eukprot:GHVR01084486.1.p1 GENE.GHVR01084486.1~~GHVR01084486.1.p1  ORF type:complete len:537 (+),score=151.45 GHVR01084486.1:73-1683(+)
MSDPVPHILKQQAHEDRGETARLQSFVGAIALGDLLKSTLGPKGMDKILQPMGGEGPTRSITVTNDGATILKNVWIDNPAAKILVDLSKTQDSECGDGTTTVVVLAAELLREAEKLIDMKIHPQLVCAGYREALQCARKALEEVSFDNKTNAEKFREDLMNIARTTLSSKLVTHDKEHFATLAVDAVVRVCNNNYTLTPNLDHIQIIKKSGGTMRDSYLEEGFLLEKRIAQGMPKKIEKCKVMIANTPMDTDKVKIYGARVMTDSFTAVADIEKAEMEKMGQKVNDIVSHGCNVFINRQLIYNYPEQLFKQLGVTVIEHSDFDGTERLAAVLGGDIASTFGQGAPIKLGTCDVIEEVMIGEDRVIRFSGCGGGVACCIVLRGSSTHVLDETERSIHDAISVLSQTIIDSRVVCGGGSTEMWMAKSVDQLASVTPGKKQLAIEAFATALRQLPRTILENGGFDAAEVLGHLKTSHNKGNMYSGIDISVGDVSDMRVKGVCESYKSKFSQLCSAAEAAEMIIRVDDIVRCAPRPRDGM